MEQQDKMKKKWIFPLILVVICMFSIGVFVLGANFLLENDAFQIETYVGGVVNDGDNISMDNSADSGYAETVSFCPDGFIQEWTLSTWNTYLPYGISLTDTTGMRYYLQMNESGNNMLLENITNIGWIPSDVASPPDHNITDCIIGNCTYFTNAVQGWNRTITNDDSLEGADLSIEAWVKSSSNATLVEFSPFMCGPGQECTIWSYINSSNTLNMFKVYGDRSGNLTVSSRRNGGALNTIYTNARIIDTNWHHIYVQIGSGTLDMYVDGSLVYDGASTTNIGDDVYLYNIVGNSHSRDSVWRGNIDEVVIRTGANAYLTADEIMENYVRGISKITISARFGTSNDTISEIPYFNLTNGQENINLTGTECLQSRIYLSTKNITLGDQIQFSSLNYTYSPVPFLFDICNETLNVSYINFTFKDEVTDENINSSLTATVLYSLGSGAPYSTTSVLHTNPESNYTFCGTPPDREFFVNFSQFAFKDTPTYPQRNYVASINLTNATYQQTMYLLSSSEGVYTTFQVLNVADQPLSNVYVTSEIQVGGEWTIIENKYTDDSGGATFWVNPDTQHRFTFVLSGYETYQTLLYPTQSAYTITLGEISTTSIAYSQGINYQLYPPSITLNNGTSYDFGFNIESSYWTLEEYGFVVTNSSGFIMGSNSDTTGTGGNITSLIDVENNTHIYMNYYWVINDTYVNGSTFWYVHSSYVGEFSLKYFFDDVKSFSKSGFNDFTRAIVGFFIILMIVGWASYNRIVEQPLTLVGLIAGLTVLLDIAGFFPVIRTRPDALGLPISVVVGILAFSYIVYEHLK